jgi:uncharacterized protein YjdB
MMPGRTASLKINPTPVEGDTNRAKWTSSNEDVVTVEYGVVTAVGKGTATVTAELKNGVKATCEVTVSGEEAFIKNGTFIDNSKWTAAGSSAVVDGTGKITADGSLSQTVTGLKPETTYQLFVRYRADVSGKVGISLTNGQTALFEKAETVSSSWVKKTFR